MKPTLKFHAAMNRFGCKAVQVTRNLSEVNLRIRALRASVVKTINNSSATMKVMVPILLEYACRWLNPWNEAVV